MVVTLCRNRAIVGLDLEEIVVIDDLDGPVDRVASAFHPLQIQDVVDVERRGIHTFPFRLRVYIGAQAGRAAAQGRNKNT